MRKESILILLAAVFITTTACFAQANKQDQIEVLSDAAEVERKAVIASNVEFSEEESKAFWPVYNEYRAEMKKVNVRLIAVIRKYAENYKNLSDAVAADIMAEAMDIENDHMIYKKLYVEDLLAILPTKKVVVLYQLENKIEAAVRYDLSLEIPLVALTEGAANKN